MKRSTRLLIGFVAAALTYGSLMAFIGPHSRGGHGFYRNHAQDGKHGYHCNNHRWGNESKPSPTAH